MKSNELPNTIFLHLHGDSDVYNIEDATLSEERIYPTDVEYTRRKSPWISVKDSLPEMQQRVLVIHKLPKRLNVYIMKRIPHDTSNPNNGKWHWSKVTNDNEVTHWMPIPSFDEILEANKDVLERIKEKGD